MKDKTEHILADHLFRHHYGKMVSILTSVFGLSNLELIEDAIQDTFIKAVQSWRNQMPDNPEAWLTQAAKNRAVDLFRQIKADKSRFEFLNSGASAIALNELFLDHEIEDSQLRMIFTACHPDLKPQDQLAFALKTISGFGQKEIAAALLLKEETVKKRLTRARKIISTENNSFSIPLGKDLTLRMTRVLEVIYLTFNEGFYSSHSNKRIQEDLCSEAIRLAQLVLTKEPLRDERMYALLTLMCFHMSRLESRFGENGEIIDLENQDRSLWYYPLIEMGNRAMNRATLDVSTFSSYHYEAAIAGEHLKARTYADTNWNEILRYYQSLHEIHPSEFSILNIAVVQIKAGQLASALQCLNTIQPEKLEQRKYLFYATWAEYYKTAGNLQEFKSNLQKAIQLCENPLEKEHLEKKLIKS